MLSAFVCSDYRNIYSSSQLSNERDRFFTHRRHATVHMEGDANDDLSHAAFDYQRFDVYKCIISRGCFDGRCNYAVQGPTPLDRPLQARNLRLSTCPYVCGGL